MRYFILCFIAFSLFSQPVLAQDSEGSSFVPLFLKPLVNSVRNTFTSNTPTIVQPTPQQQQNRRNMSPATTATGGISQSTFDRLQGPGLVDNRNPWEGTGFGRIKREVDYFDRETGRYYNQYDYMALLARRGNRSELNNVAKYLQENGVFDPRKYQAALQRRPQGQQQGRTRTQSNGGQATSPTAQPRRVQVAPQDPKVFAPKRIHEGYDEDMKADPMAKPKTGNQPIFLR
jgi:hypothetical protein